MNTKIIAFPTYRHALYEWSRLIDKYPDYWTTITKNPMSLTSKLGVKYLFIPDNQPDKLRGMHSDIIHFDEFMTEITSNLKESEDDNMAQVITAPSIELPMFKSVFLAGGISNCKDWQKSVIKELEFEDISLFNPRQEHFDVSDKSASYKQIFWEFERLEQMDIFSMYFCNDNSDQPICMYELGRNIVRMQNRFPSDWEKRIVISVEEGYRRTADVLIQTELATQNKVFVETNATSDLHSHYIIKAIRSIE